LVGSVVGLVPLRVMDCVRYVCYVCYFVRSVVRVVRLRLFAFTAHVAFTFTLRLVVTVYRWLRLPLVCVARLFWVWFVLVAVIRFVLVVRYLRLVAVVSPHRQFAFVYVATTFRCHVATLVYGYIVAGLVTLFGGWFVSVLAFFVRYTCRFLVRSGCLRLRSLLRSVLVRLVLVVSSLLVPFCLVTGLVWFVWFIRLLGYLVRSFFVRLVWLFGSLGLLRFGSWTFWFWLVLVVLPHFGSTFGLRFLPFSWFVPLVPRSGFLVWLVVPFRSWFAALVLRWLVVPLRLFFAAFGLRWFVAFAVLVGWFAGFTVTVGCVGLVVWFVGSIGSVGSGCVSSVAFGSCVYCGFWFCWFTVLVLPLGSWLVQVGSGSAVLTVYGPSCGSTRFVGSAVDVYGYVPAFVWFVYVRLRFWFCAFRVYVTVTVAVALPACRGSLFCFGLLLPLRLFAFTFIPVGFTFPVAFGSVGCLFWFVLFVPVYCGWFWFGSGSLVRCGSLVTVLVVRFRSLGLVVRFVLVVRFGSFGWFLLRSVWLWLFGWFFVSLRSVRSVTFGCVCSVY